MNRPNIPLHKSPKKPMKRWQYRAGAGFLLFILAIAFMLRVFRPAKTAGWQEIYQGVELLVQDISPTVGKGRYMAIRVKWDTPGVQLQHRLPDVPPRADSWQQGISNRLFHLEFADWALWRQQPAVLVNTTAYDPHQWWQSLPGKTVRTVETIVWEGQASHSHRDSYLLWWDSEGDAFLETSKPPDPAILQSADLAIGVQAVALSRGQANEASLGGRANQKIPRTFIGIDNANKTLYLFAFENISAIGMVAEAIALGVTDGAMVDSGDATHLLMGRNAENTLPHTGIRHKRPLAGYLMIYADPL